MGTTTSLVPNVSIMAGIIAGAMASGGGPTVMDLSGSNLVFADQIERNDFEAQSGSAL